MNRLGRLRSNSELKNDPDGAGFDEMRVIGSIIMIEISEQMKQLL